MQKTSDSTQHCPMVNPMDPVGPVVYHPAPTKLVTRTDDRQDDGAVVSVETRLGSVALDQFGQLDQLDPFSVMETTTNEMALTQTTFGECQQQLSDKVLTLVRDNGVLGQQLVAMQSREKDASHAHMQKVEDLQAQVASLQKRAAKLIEDQQNETQGLQKRIKLAEDQTQTALNAAQATWEKQKTQLNQQNSSFQAQLKSVSSQRDALQTQVNGEPQRQQAAVNEKLSRLKSNLVYLLEWEIKTGHNVKDPKKYEQFNQCLKAELSCFKSHVENLS